MRQDTDQWLLTLAASYGADIRQRCPVRRVELEEKGVRLALENGEDIAVQFVVDASGGGSLLARQLRLRDATPRFVTNSRGMFTHMVGVPPYDAVGPDRRTHCMPVPFSQSTLHHVFDGGWIWVIPFDNHQSTTSGLCSVGLVLDRNQYPEAQGEPADEFRRFVERFPSVRDQFRGALLRRGRRPGYPPRSYRLHLGHGDGQDLAGTRRHPQRPPLAL